MKGNVLHAALLAPIPEEHVRDGATVAKEHGKVAYGSRAWEVFRELDRLRGDNPVPVYIYASHAEKPIGNKITWQGLYVGHVESRGGEYPGDIKFRPPSVQRYPDDLSGYWAVYWHIKELELLVPEDWIDIGDLHRFKSQRRYGNSFTPEGPIIVGHP